MYKVIEAFGEHSLKTLTVRLCTAPGACSTFHLHKIDVLSAPRRAVDRATELLYSRVAARVFRVNRRFHRDSFYEELIPREQPVVHNLYMVTSQDLALCAFMNLRIGDHLPVGGRPSAILGCFAGIVPECQGLGINNLLNLEYLWTPLSFLTSGASFPLYLYETTIHPVGYASLAKKFADCQPHPFLSCGPGTASIIRTLRQAKYPRLTDHADLFAPTSGRWDILEDSPVTADMSADPYIKHYLRLCPDYYDGKALDLYARFSTVNLRYLFNKVMGRNLLNEAAATLRAFAAQMSATSRPADVDAMAALLDIDPDCAFGGGAAAEAVERGPSPLYFDLLPRVKDNPKRLGYPISHQKHPDPQTWKRIHDAFSTIYLNNVGDIDDESPHYNVHTKVVERDVVQRLTAHFGARPGELTGYVTCGGTIGNLACLWWLREDLAGAPDGPSGDGAAASNAPILLTSDRAHVSVLQAANILGLAVRTVASDAFGRLELAAYQRAIHEEADAGAHAVIACAVAGSTELGGIDDFVEMRRIAAQAAPSLPFALHLDGAFLGPALPLLQPFDAIGSVFKWVDTLCFSGHKYLGTAYLCGVALVRRAILDGPSFGDKRASAYLHHTRLTTIEGSRSGYLPIELHNTLRHYGIGGDGRQLAQTIRDGQEMAAYLQEQLAGICREGAVLRPPNSFTVTFPRPRDVRAAEALMHAYSLMPVGRDRFSVCVMPHVGYPLLREFIDAYRDAVVVPQAVCA